MGRITKRVFTSLLAWRDAAQLSQADAAKRFGITQGQWSLYESGANHPRPKLAKRIAEETGVPLEVVLGIATESSGQSDTLDRDPVNS